MFGNKQLKCPKCKHFDIDIQMVETGSTTKKSGVGLIGSTYNAARGVASIATLGIAGKVLPKAEGKEKTKTKLVKMALCKNCGYSWELK